MEIKINGFDGIRDLGIVEGNKSCQVPLIRVGKNPNNVEYVCDEKRGMYTLGLQKRKVGRPKALTIKYAIQTAKGFTVKTKKVVVKV